MKAERVNYDELESSTSGYEIFQKIRSNCESTDSLNGSNPLPSPLPQRSPFSRVGGGETKADFSKFFKTNTQPPSQNFVFPGLVLLLTEYDTRNNLLLYRLFSE